MVVFNEYGNPDHNIMQPLYDKADELGRLVEPIADQLPLVEVRALWGMVANYIAIYGAGYIIKRQMDIEIDRA